MADNFSTAMDQKANAELAKDIEAAERLLNNLANPIVQAASTAASVLGRCGDGAQACKTQKLYPAIDNVTNAINALPEDVRAIAKAAWKRVNDGLT